MSRHNKTIGQLAKELAVASPQATRPAVGYTGLLNGCESDPSGLHECGVDEHHRVCKCVSCGGTWPNPEWHEPAAQPAAGTTPRKFRKKPVVIEAFQFHGWTSSVSYMPRWFINDRAGCAIGVDWSAVGANIFWECLEPEPRVACVIKTLEGNMRAEIGDWIIRGIKGEIYPCKPDIFEATYEPVE